MGDRGPPATPDAIKEQRGTARRHEVKKSPKPKAGNVRMPRGLSNRGKTVWKNLLPELRRLNLATDVDVYALHRYCSSVAEWCQLDEYLAKHNLTHTVMMSTGIPKVEARPEVALRNQAHVVCLQIEKQFGLTPSARVRLYTDDTGDDTDNDKKEDAANARREFMKSGGLSIAR